MFVFEQLKLQNNYNTLNKEFIKLKNNTDNIDEIKISLVSKFSPEKDELINKNI